MDRVEADETPAEAWKASLNATCNRLMTHYAALLRASSSDQDASSAAGAGAAAANDGRVGTDPRAGGGCMVDANDPPTPLAAHVRLSAVQAKIASENLCVAASNALDLISTLRLSVLLMDEELVRAEEEEESLALRERGLKAEEECALLEDKLTALRGGEHR